MARKTTTSVPSVASFDEYKALTEAQQGKLAKAIHDDRDAGLSGNDMRERYGDWLTGPRRRKVLRQFGLGAVIAPSYDEYTDDAAIAKVVGGKTRTGTRHARFHGHGKRAENARLTLAQQKDQATLAAAAKRQTATKRTRKAKATTSK